MADVRISPDDHLRAEIVVLGSGPGGSCAASLLSEAGRDVLLVEEGEHYEPTSSRPFSSDEMVQKYRNGGLTVTLGRPKVAYVEGRCVGGGSEINSGLYHRAPPDVLNEWKNSHRVEGLDEASLLPHYEANERELCVSKAPGNLPAASLKLYDGACRLGWQAGEVPRWYRYDSTGAGTKQTMTRTFVPRALGASARLVARTRAIRLRRHPGFWRIQAEQQQANGRVRRSIIDGANLIVACGAIQTPALMRRSGIGQHVGNSLHLHPTVKVVARFPEEVNRLDAGVPVHQVRQFAPQISMGCSISSPPYLKLAMIDQPEHSAEIDRDWRRMAVYYAMSRGGRGSVRPIPWFRDPLVRYNLTRADLAELADGLTKLCRCLLAAGAEVLYPCIPGNVVIRDENDLAAIPRELPAGRTSLMTIHLFSSCPMGEDRQRCTTDSFGRVHGETGLWIADASLLPGPPGVNPQGSVMAIVRRNVAHFLESN
jgi:choline dehydrogenase-like flavoprotein